MALNRSIFLALFFLSLACFSSVHAQGIPDEDWGYVDVRSQAHMFWWLMGKKDTSTRSTAPLIMWLQGGPGASSTGYGNFEEIGPQDVNLKPRENTWLSVANLIFVDNPVGSGYSYVDNASAYTVNEDQIAADLLTLFKAVLMKHPILQTVPFYIFCESYGGKMAASFAYALAKASNASQIKVNFKAVALGDSWIDPLAFIDAWVPYLQQTSEIDDNTLGPIQTTINATHTAMAQGKYTQATNLWSTLEGQIGRATAGVNWYNILDRSGSDFAEYGMSGYLRKTSADPLTTLMNGTIKKKLGIPSTVTWGGQSGNVFNYLKDDFMQSVVGTVDNLLNAGLHVVVYSGNLDLICCTPGTLAWMNELKWSGMTQWYARTRATWSAGGVVAGYEKSYANLRMFFVFDAGHMVPTDQPVAALTMVKSILAQ